jgi:hypothetical protein
VECPWQVGEYRVDYSVETNWTTEKVQVLSGGTPNWQFLCPSQIKALVVVPLDGVSEVVLTLFAPGVQTASRRVIVRNINECSLPRGNAKYHDWHDRCAPDARCEDTNGSYRCVCPKVSRIMPYLGEFVSPPT